MSQDKELEIQLQFLDEAFDYLSILDAPLLGLASTGIDIDKTNAALRSSHSIKGGAGMMGFQTLSDLAHRLEDFFKVLKLQKQTLQVDAELEQLLLAGVDCLRRAIQCQRQMREIDPSWLETYVDPIFEKLRQRLGEPTEEDAQSILSPEEGQEIIPVLFQTEVEGCIQRLEVAIEKHDPRLREEVEILTQELGGLGEMLQLTPFFQLCESIAHQLDCYPEQAEWIAQHALEAWRQSQTLILAGYWNNLPTAIPSPPQEISLGVVVEQPVGDVIPFKPIDLDYFVTAAELDGDSEVISQPEVGAIPSVILDTVIPDTVISDITVPNPAIPDIVIPNPALPNPAIPDSMVPGTVIPDTAAVSDFRVSDPQVLNLAGKELLDNTVRVSVKQLDQLNELFSELIVERNGLDLYLKRLRGLVEGLSHRVRVLEESNTELRDAYDKVENQINRSSLNIPDFVSRKALDQETTGGQTHEFDALEMDRYNARHLLSQEVMETIVQVQEATSDIELELDDIEQTTRELNKTSRQLQTRLTQVRMRPISDITNRFPRALRELSLQYQKPVQLKVQGENLLIDRNILEALNEPLLHLLRNAFDHGIEISEVRQQRGKPAHGTIKIQAEHRQNRTVITISDDGGGIPVDKIRARARQMGLDDVLLTTASDEELLSLIFEPGFSTSDRVTALSGRGVGMDVVRNRLKQIHGEINVATKAGEGTTFTLSVPFTLSVARVLLTESRGMQLAFSTDAFEEILVVEPEQIVSTSDGLAFDWNGTMVQLLRLSQWLHVHRPIQSEGFETSAAIKIPTVLLVNQNNQRLGLQVDRCWGEQEVAIRQVEGQLPLPPGFGSCTILGDGRVVPLVNLAELLNWITSCEQTNLDLDLKFPAARSPMQMTLQTALSGISLSTTMADHQPTVLIVDDSINVRRFLALTLEKAGYQVAQAKDGQDAIDKLSAGLTVQAVICDIEMPRVDGYEFLARVKSTPTWKEIPIAMLTSRSGDKHRRLAMSLGATAYFSKPYNEQTLLQTLERMVDLAPA